MLDLLLSDDTNPRSVAFQLARLGEHAEELPPVATGAALQPETEVLLRLTGLLWRADLTELGTRDVDGRLPALDAMLGEIVAGLADLSLSLTRNYLAHAAPPRLVTSA